MKAHPRSHVVVGLVLGLAVVAVIGIVGAMLEYKYGPVDPTDPGWKALVTNDTPQTVYVGDSAEDLQIQPGRSEILVPPAPGQLKVVYTVTEFKHQTLGCLAVSLDRQQTVKVNVSLTRVLDGPTPK